MSKIIKKIPSAKLLLLARKSPNEGTSPLESAASLNQSIKLLLGVQTQDDLIRYLALSDVIFLPFRFWPHIDCPLTILEAMAMEKTVVTSDTGVISEIVQDGETGILVPVNERENISEVLIKLLMDENISTQIGKNARKYVKNFYDWDIIMRQTSNIFEKVI
jgi:glycosyltransferase involved in cell wall biosynthesis